MKYCLSSRNQRDYLSKADEIKVEYRDRKEIPDLFERYPEATIILQCFFYEEDLEWGTPIESDIFAETTAMPIQPDIFKETDAMPLDMEKERARKEANAKSEEISSS